MDSAYRNSMLRKGKLGGGLPNSSSTTSLKLKPKNRVRREQ